MATLQARLLSLISAIGSEFKSVRTALSAKAPLASPVFSGTASFENLTTSARPSFNGATPWDSLNFNPLNFSGSVINGGSGGITIAGSGGLTVGGSGGLNVTGSGGLTTTKLNAPLYISASTAGGGSAAGRSVVNLAQFRASVSDATGAIVFTAPNADASIMLVMAVLGMTYTVSTAGDPGRGLIDFSARAYHTSTAISQALVKHKGSVRPKVRFAKDASGKFCLILGDVSSVWVYPHIALTGLLISHTNASDAYCSGWTSGLVTDLTGYTDLTTADNADAPSPVSVTGSFTPDFASSDSFAFTLTGNATMAVPLGMSEGQSGVIYFIQDATGSRTLGLNAAIKKFGTFTLSTAPGAVDRCGYFVRSGVLELTALEQGLA